MQHDNHLTLLLTKWMGFLNSIILLLIIHIHKQRGGLLALSYVKFSPSKADIANKGRWGRDEILESPLQYLLFFSFFLVKQISPTLRYSVILLPVTCLGTVVSEILCISIKTTLSLLFKFKTIKTLELKLQEHYE